MYPKKYFSNFFIVLAFLFVCYNKAIAAVGLSNDNAVYIFTDTSMQDSDCFLGNLIRSASVGNLDKEIYNKILIGQKSDAQMHNAIWIHTNVGQSNFLGGKNSIFLYKDTNYGATFGFNGWNTEKFSLGIFTKYQKNDVYQGDSNANIDNIGGGIYAGFHVGSNIEIKSLVSALRNNITSQRIVSDDAGSASADFSALSFGGDVEVSLRKIGVADMSFRPYLGIEVQQVGYDEFYEKNTNGVVLDASNDYYNRGFARLGGELRYGDERTFGWYGNVEIKYMISGNSPLLHLKNLDSLQDEFESIGFKEHTFVVGLGLGITANIYKDLKLYSELNYYGGESYENYRANFGIKYDFGEIVKSESVEDVDKPKGVVPSVKDFQKAKKNIEEWQNESIAEFEKNLLLLKESTKSETEPEKLSAVEVYPEKENKIAEITKLKKTKEEMQIGELRYEKQLTSEELPTTKLQVSVQEAEKEAHVTKNEEQLIVPSTDSESEQKDDKKSKTEAATSTTANKNSLIEENSRSISEQEVIDNIFEESKKQEAEFKKLEAIFKANRLLQADLNIDNSNEKTPVLSKEEKKRAIKEEKKRVKAQKNIEKAEQKARKKLEQKKSEEEAAANDGALQE
jgi:hypothetical protein